MPSSRDLTGGRRTGASKKNAFCSFCRKSYRDVGPLVEGPGDVYICGECIELCQSILDQERKRRGSSKQLFTKIPSPREIVAELDQYVIGQDSAKRVLAVAVHSHYKRLMAAEEEAEVDIDNDQLFVAITAQQHDNLLNEVQAISLDYTDRPVLVEGRIRSFMGFNFIHSERIPGGPSYAGSVNTGGLYYVPCWAKSGLALGMWNDVQASVDKRPDKRNSWQVYVTATVGACRTEEKRCVQINCA